MTQIHLSRSTRNEWMKAIYENGLVTCTEYSKKLSNKLFCAIEMEKHLGPCYENFFPKTLELKSLVKKYNWLNKANRIEKTKSQISEDLKKEFPLGYIVKPAVGHSSGGREAFNFYLSEDNFLRDFFEKTATLVGQALIFQDHLIKMANGAAPEKPRSSPELRIHSYENKVVSGASIARWRWSRLSKKQIQQAETKVEDLLRLLPTEILVKQAFSFDVLLLPNLVRIVDINTNQGLPHQWSGYMTRPRFLKAYTLHFEKYAGVEFTGLSSLVVKLGFGNFMKLLKKRHIEGIW
ncbi:MAG: hypothetical protein AB7O96_09615 [Pseudobdellovibrionaceae bacterium]